jgi:hypothetical protein
MLSPFEDLLDGRFSRGEQYESTRKELLSPGKGDDRGSERSPQPWSVASGALGACSLSGLSAFAAQISHE